MGARDCAASPAHSWGVCFKAFVSWKILGKFSCPYLLKTDKMGERKYVPHMHYFFIHLFFLLLLGGDKNWMNKYCAELECLKKNCLDLGCWIEDKRSTSIFLNPDSVHYTFPVPNTLTLCTLPPSFFPSCFSAKGLLFLYWPNLSISSHRILLALTQE